MKNDARRLEALENGEKRFISAKPCKKCGGCVRYVKSPHHCIECNARRVREHYSRHKSDTSFREYKQDRYLLKKYNMGLDTYKEMLSEQNGLCAICHKRPRVDTLLVVDHNHDTGSVRGLLCSPCNVGLGCFRDDEHSLLRAIKYLMTHEVKK